MKSRLAAALLAVLPIAASAQIPPTYYDGVDTSSSSALRTSLANLLATGFDNVSYGNAYAAMAICDEDPLNTANVELLYTGDSRDKTLDCTTTGCEDSSPSTGEYNREHTWPQSSFGSGDEPMYSDMHALFPADADVNNDRSNDPYDYVLVTPTYTTPNGLRGGGGLCEPADEDKGRVARALMYMDVRYDGDAGENDLVLNDAPNGVNGGGQFGMLSTLIEWHNAFPPDAREEARNEAIYDLGGTFVSGEQGNANPFIDHPEWVEMVWPPTGGDTLAVASVDRAPSIAAADAEVPMLTLVLTANSGEFDLESIVLQNLGTADDAEISAIKLYFDGDNSGTVTSADPYITSSTFSAGTCTFPLRKIRIKNPAPGFRRLLFTLDTASTIDGGDTLQLGVAANGISETPDTGGTDVNPTFSAIASGTTTIAGGAGGVVISEIMYNPNSTEPAGEWIEIFNTSTTTTAGLAGWTIDDDDASGATFTVSLAPLEAAVLVRSTMSDVDFQAAWGTGFQIIQCTGGFPDLANDPAAGSEPIQLLDDTLALVDEVSYDDGAPWPTDNNAASIYLVNPNFSAAANDAGSAWARSQVGVANAHSPTAAGIFSASDVGSPGSVFAPALATELDAFMID